SDFEFRNYGSASPAHDGRSPGQAGAETAQDDQVVGLKAAFLAGLVQGQGDGAGRGVAVLVEVVEDPAAGNVQDVNGGVDDANVGLVGNVQVDLVGAQAAVVQDILNGVAQDGDGPPEDGPAIHVHVVQAFLQKFRGGGQAAAASGAAQKVAAAAIGPKAIAEDALVGSATGEENRPGAVAEQG